MSRIAVCCRIRPSIASSDGSSIGVNDERDTITSLNPSYAFKFDRIFSAESSQDEVFNGVAKPLITEWFKGINGTLLSYGQTGSGKTYSMQGKDNTNELGIIPRAANMIYHEITNNNINFEVKLSVLEIYKEKLSDLLSDNKNNNQNNLRIREHSGSSFGTSVWVEGLIETSISNVNEFMDTLNIAYKKRTTASHKMNEQSSRSHLIVVVSLKQVLSGGKKVLSKLHLIDLAGSEMVRKTDASGKRLDEAKHINKSLSALGKVIYALSSSTSSSSSGSSGDNNTTAINARAPAHIPYRDSKLTRLLQDSLGGNAKTVLLLAVSAASIHIQESIATLRFGERARQVCTRPIVNTELDESSLKSALATAKKTIITLNATITELQLQLLQATTNSTNTSGVCQTCMSSLVSTASPTITKKTTAHTTPINVIPTQYTSLQKENDDDGVTTRCAVCGLNDEGSDALKDETGENLGCLFTCDGNCGNKYHTKCVGIENENGPEGEWLCSTCTYESIGTSSLSYEENEEKNDINNQLELIKAEYHIMRRERNRILAQWQQEKKVSLLLEQKRQEIEIVRDRDHIATVEELTLVKENYNQKMNDYNRLEKLHEQLLESLRMNNRSGNEAVTLNVSPAASSKEKLLKHSVLWGNENKKLLMTGDASSTIERVGNKLLSSPPSEPITPITYTKTVVDTDVIPYTKSMTSSATALMSMSLSSSSITASSNTSIPKPWLMRKKAAPKVVTVDTDDIITTDDTIQNPKLSISPIKAGNKIDDSVDGTSSSSTTGSRYLDPLKNRLQDLIKSVEAEKDSYKSIREKFDNRASRQKQ